MIPKPITPKVNFLFKTKSDVKPLPKLMKLLFLVFHVVFALDFGFHNFQTSRTGLLMKIVTLIQATVIGVFLTYAIFFKYAVHNSTWYFMDVIIYYLYVVLMLVSKNNFYNLQMDLHSFDREIEADSDAYKVEYKILAGFLVIVIFRTLIVLSYCMVYIEYCVFPAHIQVAFFVPMIGLNIVLIVYTFLFQSVYYRMKQFSCYVKNDYVDVVSCHYLYKNIVEFTEKTKKTFDLVLVLSLIFNTVDVTVTVYVPFAEQIVQSGNAFNVPVAYILVVQELVMLFAPAFTAGLLTSQVEALKLVLYDKLVRDQKHTIDIKRFISYIDARPLRFKVWMVIPLDWSLPVIVINISVTYLIVMIQFTHKS